MSMGQAGKPIDRIHRTAMNWKHWSIGELLNVTDERHVSQV